MTKGKNGTKWVKGKTWFKDKIFLLTLYEPKCSFETELGDYYYMIYTKLKTTFPKNESNYSILNMSQKKPKTTVMNCNEMNLKSV